jgi:hypothetical protein
VKQNIAISSTSVFSSSGSNHETNTNSNSSNSSEYNENMTSNNDSRSNQGNEKPVVPSSDEKSSPGDSDFKLETIELNSIGVLKIMFNQ